MCRAWWDASLCCLICVSSCSFVYCWKPVSVCVSLSVHASVSNIEHACLCYSGISSPLHSPWVTWHCPMLTAKAGPHPVRYSSYYTIDSRARHVLDVWVAEWGKLVGVGVGGVQAGSAGDGGCQHRWGAREAAGGHQGGGHLALSQWLQPWCGH